MLRHTAAWKVALLASALAAGCGGGSEPPLPPIAMTFSVPVLTGSAYQHQGTISPNGTPPLRVSATLDALPSVDVSVVVVLDRPVFLAGELLVYQTGERTFEAELTPDTSLAPGTYEGTLRVLLCRDAGCATPYPVTGNALPYRLTIAPLLEAVVSVDGAEVARRSSGSGVCLGSNTYGPLHVVTGSTLDVSANLPIAADFWPEAPAHVPGPDSGAARWQARIDATSPAYPCMRVFSADGSGQALDLQLYVGPPRVVSPVSKVTIALAANQTQPLPRQVIQLGTENGVTSAYRTELSDVCCGAQQWLSFPATGTAPGDLTLQVARSNLAAGSYSARLTLIPVAGGFTTTIDVRLVVTALAASPASVAFSIDAASTPDRARQALALGDTGTPLAWSAAVDQPWAVVSPASGVTTDAMEVALDPARLQAMPAGRHTATATFTLDMGGGATAAVKVPVSLTLGLPRIDQVMPRASVAGVGGDVALSGSGFPEGYAGPIWFGAEPAVAVTRTSATTLRVTPPSSLEPGTYPIRLENALGVPRSGASLVVVEPAPARAAATIAAPGAKRALIVDDVRRALFVADAGAVVRLREEAGWVKAADGSDELPLPGLKNLALSADGATLVAVAGQAFRLLDADTLVLRDRQPVTAAPADAVVALGMTVANQAYYVGYSPTTAGSTWGTVDVASATATSSYRNPYYSMAFGPDGTKVAEFSWDQTSVGVWTIGGVYARTDRYQEGLFGSWDRNATRLLVYGDAHYDNSIDGNSRVLSRLYDASLTLLPGTVAPRYTGGTVPADPPPPTQAVVLSPLGRARAYAWDGSAVRCYDLVGTLDANGVYPVLFSVPAAPGANAKLALAADERTAFLAGDDAVVVVPLPP